MIKNKKIFIIGIVIILVIFNSCSEKSNTTKDKSKLPDFDNLWDYSNPAKTEMEFRKLIPLAKKTGDTSYYLQLMTQIARTEGLQLKFQKAHETLDSVKITISQKYPKAYIRYLLERGRVYNSSGSKEQARKLFLQAYEFGSKENVDIYTIDAAHMLGIVSPTDEQIKWNLKALKIAQKTEEKKAKGWLGPLYNNIGWSYHDKGNYRKALNYFQKDLTWRKKIKDETGARISKWTIGRTYRSLGKIDSALTIQIELQNFIKNNNLKPDGYVFEEIGECYLEKKNKELAKKYFQNAYEILSEDPWLKKNQSKRLQRLKELSQ